MVGPLNTIDRTAELLEFFTSAQEPAGGFRVKDVVSSLGYAQSTTSVLLNRLTELGYLRRVRRRFFPTPRLGALGSSYLAHHPEARHLDECLSQIHSATGHLCFLAQINGANIQYITFKPSVEPSQPRPPNGLMRPLAIAASGRALLSQFAPDDARRIIRRNNLELSDQGWWVNESEVMEDLQVIRERGFAKSDPCFTPGLVGIATCLCGGKYAVPYAIGVALPEGISAKGTHLAIRALSKLPPPAIINQ